MHACEHHADVTAALQHDGVELLPVVEGGLLFFGSLDRHMAAVHGTHNAREPPLAFEVAGHLAKGRLRPKLKMN